MNHWQRIEEDVFLHRDSCQVYAVRGRNGSWLIINAGAGGAAGRLAQLGDVSEVSVLLTHHFRDHTAGAELFRQRGARIHAPFGEREHLSDPQQAFKAGEPWLLYNLAWDHFAPIKPLQVDRWMRDYERLSVAGLSVEVIPAPGVTLGAVALLVESMQGRRLAFVGELMSEPGRLARLSPLQYQYNDLLGGDNVLRSWERVLATRPELALPSMGEPFAGIAEAVALLRTNLERFDIIQPGYAARLAEPSDPGVEEVLPRLYRAKKTVAETYFILGRSGRVLALDYGYDMASIRLPGRATFSTRRTLLHSVESLRKLTGAGRIDTVLATHYHDDHVGGVHLLQRLFGTELWAADSFADLIERPADYDRPCLWPEPIQVHRRLPLEQAVQWEDVKIILHPMVGHTEFSTLLCLEFDGHRVAHTGDQFFYQNDQGGWVAPAAATKLFTNHVYRNGLALGGYLDCLRQLKAFQPEVILSGHALPYKPDENTWTVLERTAPAFDEIHRALLPLDDNRAHFGPESQAAKLQPYLVHLQTGESEAAIWGWVLNPHNRPAQAEIRFVVPDEGWEIAPVRLTLAAREKKSFRSLLAVKPGQLCRRQPIALDFTVDGHPYGQVAEAWVTVGHERF